MRSVVLLVLATLAWPAVVGEGFQGRLTMVEVLRGPRATSEREELEGLARHLEERIRRHREDLVAAGPLSARILKEDLGFLQAEQERIVLRGGGDLAVGTATVIISQGRLLWQADDANLQIDRNRGLGLSETAGVVRKLPLAPPPEVSQEPGVPGPSAFGRATRQYQRVVAGHPCEVVVIPGLPNPWAMSLPEGAAEDDLASTLALLPGLPVVATWTDGPLIRAWRVTSLEAGPVDERVFIPWTVTP
jgi:hypothetical protein